MRRSVKAMLDRTERLSGAERAHPSVMIFGNPKVGRLQYLGRIPAGVMTWEREAVIGEEHLRLSLERASNISTPASAILPASGRPHRQYSL